MTDADLTGDPAWAAARADLVPSVGERVADLICRALLDGAGDRAGAERIAAALRGQGDDPDAPVLTEVESLLVGWAAAAGAGRQLDAEVRGRLEAETSAALRGRLDTLAAATRARLA